MSVSQKWGEFMTAQSKLIEELEVAKKHQQRQNYKTNY
jgi:hypothetical protein